jgi:hypothetical protein
VKQPATGIVAALVVIAISLGFISFFSFGTFTGWVAYFIQCMIPMQIIIGVTWGSNQPAFAQKPQPLKGLILILLSVLSGIVVAYTLWATIGGRVSPPTPMPIMFTIASVLTTFWLAIMFGGWPFTSIFKNPVAAGLAVWVAAYAITYAIYRIGFDFAFLKGAPIYLPELDPHGAFNAWNITVWYITAVGILFLLLHFDLWPFTLSGSIMKQPTLGIVWTIVAAIVGTAAYYIGVTTMHMDVVAFMISVPIPFIFGTIIVLNMLQGSMFASLKQPVKGIMNAAAAMIVGSLLAWAYASLSKYTTGDLHSGPPPYELEIWTASALLGVTFPFLIFSAEFFRLWPFHRPQMEAQAKARATGQA